jgi:asparagine synthase (glutamine-hydrolysing)
MCGIAGLCALYPVRPAAVAAMVGTMAHRGPDDQGLWAAPNGHVVLGHRRLSILDISAAGHQPMARDGVVIVFNGEIYNYRELRQDLEACGASFHSGSDTEVMLAAYGQWGPAFVERLNGMFAFAIHDPARRLLFCARDRYGEKPFLFAPGVGFFAFASEYKALLTIAGTDHGIDDALVLSYLVDSAHGLDDRRRTAFRGIRQLLPAESLTLDLDSLEWQIRSYWQPRAEPGAAGLSFPQAVERFRELLTDSISLRLRSDVPVGSCLSGGLDSSAIVCLALGQLPKAAPYHVFTGRFPGTGADEWERAELTVRATGVLPHVVAPTAEGFLADLPHFMWMNELPVGSTSQYAQYCVFRLAAQTGITVLLDGQGADELLGGYEQYFRVYLAGLSPRARRAEAERIRRRYPAALASRRQALSGLLPNRLRWAAAALSGGGSDVLFGLSAGALAAQPSRAVAEPGLAHPLADTLRHDSFVGHLPCLLRYGDRNSMAHSREVRLPFCDHRLAEFVFAQPAEYLMGEAQTKRLLREAMRGVLPEGVRANWPKQGFRPPQELWFSGPLFAAARDAVEDPSFAAQGCWNMRWWRSVLRRFQAGETHLAWVLWRPLISQAWRHHFVARAQALPPEAVRP